MLYSTTRQWNLHLTNGQGTVKFVRYNEVSLYQGSFSIFYYYWGKENRSFYRGLRYTVFVKSRFHCILV